MSGNNNGNGHSVPAVSASTGASQLPNLVDQLQELPPWMKALREAMTGSISGDDVKDIMKAQVAKAKTGDVRAADFVMKQAHKMMEAQASLQRPVSITQNNYYDQPASVKPDTPLEPEDAGGRDLIKLRAAARAGVPLTGRPEDRRVRSVGDEEETLRHRQQQEEEELNARGPEGD